MRLFGLEITRAKKPDNVDKTLQTVSGGWVPIIRESYTGAWQRNEELTADDLLACFAIYACTTLIADDIAKLRPSVQRMDSRGIWADTNYRNATALLRRPNRYQNHIQFKSFWTTSKLRAGNTYALKERDRSGNIVALYILDPTRVQTMVTDEGEVYYKLFTDDLRGVPKEVVVPASEIIHDRMACLFHPLVGIPPLYANSLAASQANKIQNDSLKFFSNGARPSGILTAPGAISDETAQRLKADYEANFTGNNSGKVSVLGDGLKFEAMKMTALDAQLVDQLKLTVDIVCSTYHVPPFKVGFGSLPSGGKVEDLNLIYYADCLQSHIESYELALGEGLGLPDDHRIELDVTGLLRMDTATQYDTLGKGVGGSILAPNEARRKINLPPLEGGDTIYMQQQNYSLEALAKRDAQPDPFSTAQPAPAPAPADDTDDDADDELDNDVTMMLRPIKLPAPRPTNE